MVLRLEHNTRVVALQEIAREEFGVRDALVRPLGRKIQQAVSLELKYNRNALADLMRSQYTLTQEILETRGISDVISYRAYIWSSDGDRPPWALEGSLGDVVEAPQQPLTSWSPDRQMIADWLKERRDHGVILAARHSAQDIVSLPATGMGFLDQKRWVRLAGDHRAVVDSTVSELRSFERQRTAMPGHEPDGPALGGVAATIREATPPAGPGWRPQTGAGEFTGPAGCAPRTDPRRG